MKLPVRIDFIGEGATDDLIAEKLIEFVGAEPGVSYRKPSTGSGKSNLDKKLKGLNAGAAFANPVLVLRDLDDDEPCPSRLIDRLIQNKNKKFFFRVCVKSAESWLLADEVSYKDYCGIKKNLFPRELEGIGDLKRTITGWAESGAAPKLRKFLMEHRERGVADWATMGRWHADYIQTAWSLDRAIRSGKAPSLNRAVNRLRKDVDD